MRTHELPRRRRHTLGVAACGALTALLAACGSSTASSGTPGGSAPGSAPVTSSAPSTADEIGGDSSGATSTAMGATTAVPTEPAPSSAPQVPTSVTSSAPSRPRPPAGFVGTWYGHGRTLVISADGTVDVTFRLYVTCTDTITTGCDHVDGNGITDGGHATGYVSAVTNATTLRVTVQASTAPKDIPLGTVKVGHDVGHHAVAIFTSTFQNAPFCGTDAPSGYCGA